MPPSGDTGPTATSKGEARTDLPKPQPEFTAAIRGYDRVQVDEYVERLHLLLGDAEERVRAAEDDLEFSRHATVGPRVSQIFDLAVAESQELRDRAQRGTKSMQAEPPQLPPHIQPP